MTSSRKASMQTLFRVESPNPPFRAHHAAVSPKRPGGRARCPQRAANTRRCRKCVGFRNV